MNRMVARAGLAFAVAAVAVTAFVFRESLDAGALDRAVAVAGPAAPLLFIVLYALGAMTFLPGSLFALAGGALFGPVAGTIVNLVGATLGAALSFLVARYVAGDFITRRAGGAAGRMLKGVEEEGWRFVAFVRLVPVFPFNLSNYAFGLTKIAFWPYVAATFVAMIPGAAAFTWLGHAGREAMAGQTSAIRWGLLALALLAAIAVLPRLVGRIRGDKPATVPTGWIDVAEFAAVLEREPVALIVDVRSAEEFVGSLGHVGGAVNIPVGDFGGKVGEIATEKRPVYLICRTDRRSAAAAEMLAQAGFTEAVVVRGGMEAWSKDGRPVLRT